MFGDFGWFGTNPEKKKRTPIPQSKKTDIYMRSQGRCSKCRKLITNGVKPHIHHKNGDPTDHRKSNLKLLCPNCHSATHSKTTKRKKSTNDGWDNPFGNTFDNPFF